MGAERVANDQASDCVADITSPARPPPETVGASRTVAPRVEPSRRSRRTANSTAVGQTSAPKRGGIYKRDPVQPVLGTLRATIQVASTLPTQRTPTVGTSTPAGDYTRARNSKTLITVAAIAATASACTSGPASGKLGSGFVRTTSPHEPAIDRHRDVEHLQRGLHRETRAREQPQVDARARRCEQPAPGALAHRQDQVCECKRDTEPLRRRDRGDRTHDCIAHRSSAGVRRLQSSFS